MDPYTMVVAIVAIAMGAGIINRAIKAKHSKKTLSSDPRAQDYERRIEKLEDRVRVLEKIVTDKRHILADEIDDL